MSQDAFGFFAYSIRQRSELLQLVSLSRLIQSLTKFSQAKDDSWRVSVQQISIYREKMSAGDRGDVTPGLPVF